MTRPEFRHMAAALRSLGASFDATGRQDIGDVYREKANGLDGGPEVGHDRFAAPHNAFGNEDCWCRTSPRPDDGLLEQYGIDFQPKHIDQIRAEQAAKAASLTPAQQIRKDEDARKALDST